jgi:hypothetical protein
MGKASSNKKVARAAGTSGGRTSRGRTPWMYYLAIGAVVLLGVAGVYTSRNHRLTTVAATGRTAPPRVGQDHWHVAYAVYICGKLQPAITDQTDPTGIHTHGDGVIHVHPYVDSVAGKNATLGKFASAVHMTLNAGELKLPGGKDYRDGDSCEGKPGRVQVQIFSSPTDTVGTLATVDPRDIPLQNNQLLTIAFMPKGATIPPPGTGATGDPVYNLEHLNDVAATTPTTTTPTTTAGAPATTVPGSTSTTTGATTTAPASTTSTTAK